MKIQSYNDMKVKLVSATETPAHMVGLAMDITMRRDELLRAKPVSEKTCAFLVDAEHMSLFEHVTYTFLVQGMSRALLAQITRQRTASPTSGSQHYQDYRDYPCTAHPAYVDDPRIAHVLKISLDYYDELMNTGVPKEEARMVLPNAATVNYLWTIDARNLFYFLRQRLCYRNVAEMQIFADRVLTITVQHFPQLFNLAGPQCYRGECKQGKLQCGVGPWIP